MEYYKLNKYGGILQTTKIGNKDYTRINQENGNILFKKNIVITDIDEAENYNFKNSTINGCCVNNEELNKLKYAPILRHIYEQINDGAIIIKKSKIHIFTVNKKKAGYTYLDKIGIGYNNIDINKCLREIINQCIENELKLEMEIILKENNEIINVRIN